MNYLERDNDERSFSCSSKSAGLYAYPGDCHKYYYCTYGSSEPTIGNCVGAAFSPSLGRCVAVSRANC
ncbi:uncharacterized protein B0P05DRAFT_531588 [Gilbertella persicaria]|uniref:uncharacterized protein n=1 Tax=Gilbertella persicaria TaxID=101096 RepID=UPI0022210748|nr:uncharacterized protein B0P05DRAFT_531588 [Gilbertella persicaria]KAI8087600.1 hypothetical protein B0P05DRAFT_531588 [Gilbertella persicaria]